MPDAQSIMAQLLYLMTRYTHAPHQEISAAISEHLTMLSCHPDCDSKQLQAAAHRLASSWRQETRLKQLNAEPSLLDGERVVQAGYKNH